MIYDHVKSKRFSFGGFISRRKLQGLADLTVTFCFLIIIKQLIIDFIKIVYKHKSELDRDTVINISQERLVSEILT